MDRELLDAAALAGHLIPQGSMFAFLAAHQAEPTSAHHIERAVGMGLAEA
jgi:hypothetical protein